jgi:hypothetical protein
MLPRGSMATIKLEHWPLAGKGWNCKWQRNEWQGNAGCRVSCFYVCNPRNPWFRFWSHECFSPDPDVASAGIACSRRPPFRQPMLSFLVSIPIIAAAVIFTARTARLMWRLKAGWKWWSALCLLVCVGVSAGCRLGYCEIQTSPTFRWAGLPLPIGFFVLEGDHWTDFIPPPEIQWTNFLADILAPVLVLVIPFLVVWRRRDKMRVNEDAVQPIGE